MICREDARGVAGVAAATPKFQVLLYKMVLKWISKKFLYTVGYPNLKFLTSSLHILHCHFQTIFIWHRVAPDYYRVSHMDGIDFKELQWHFHHHFYGGTFWYLEIGIQKFSSIQRLPYLWLGSFLKRSNSLFLAKNEKFWLLHSQINTSVVWWSMVLHYLHCFQMTMTNMKSFTFWYQILCSALSNW